MALFSRHRGFTLVESIITVAILAVVAALLFSAFGMVKRRSLDSKCVLNLRQLGMAGIQFAADNKGRLPYRSDWASATNSKTSLLPYLGFNLRKSGDPELLQPTVLTCPATLGSKVASDTEFYRTYSINQYATGSGGDDTWDSQVRARGAPLKIGNIPQAAKQAFFMDGTLLPSGTGYRYSTHQAPDRIAPLTNDWPGTPGTRTPFVHRGYINVVFLDGHVEMVSEQRAKEELVGNTNGNVKDSTRTHPFWGATK